MIIYLVGNPLLKSDSMPWKIKSLLAAALPEIQFLEFDPTENWPDERHPLFIDTVVNLKEPKLFTDVDAFELLNYKKLSVHGFDFYTELKLRKKIGLYNDYCIIGIPAKKTPKKLLKTINIIRLLKSNQISLVL